MTAKPLSNSLVEEWPNCLISSTEIQRLQGPREETVNPQSPSYEYNGGDCIDPAEQDDMDGIKEADFGDAGALLSPTISRFQAKLASVQTPAFEKEAMIREGDGYFSLPPSSIAVPTTAEDSQESSGSQSSEASSPTESPLHESIMDSDGHYRTSHSNTEETMSFHANKGLGINNRDFAPGSTVLINDQAIDKGNEESPEALDNSQATSQERLGSSHSSLCLDRHQRPSLTLYQMPSDGSIHSYHRALSRASSLGDDERFGHIKKQGNNRSKAFWDSMPSPNFHLQIPTLPLPSLAKVLSAFPNTTNSPPGSPKRGVSEEESNRSSSNVGLSSAISLYPAFTKAVDQLEGDLVILGGYRGSILKSTKPPFQKIWPPPLRAMVDISTVDLEVGFEEDSEDKAAEAVQAGGMIKNIGPIDISRRLFKRLRASPNVKSGKLRVHDYSYDWRLSPTRLSHDFINFIEGLQCNSAKTPVSQRGATVIAHSLGGLLTRYAVNQKPHLFAGVLYAGTPQQAVNILGPFKFNDSVLRSTRILTAQTNFSVRTSFALLPIDGKCFVDEKTKKELPVDFFNVNDWIKYRLSPCIGPPLPPSTPPQPSKSILETITSTIPLIGRRTSSYKDGEPSSPSTSRGESPSLSSKEPGLVERTSTFAPQLESRDRSSSASFKPNYLPITISREKAIEYLTRTLAEVKEFKLALNHRPEHSKSNAYPPVAVVYGKSEPSVKGSKVRGYDSIGCIDVYKDENLFFGSGDGVVLSRAAMLPEGYKAAKGGVIGTNRGHVTLLADLEAVGKALHALSRARKHGVGKGALKAWENTNGNGMAKVSG